MYIVSNNEASHLNAVDFEILEQLPAGVWTIGYKPVIGNPYFYKIDYNILHGKIYGNAEDIASHVIKAFETVNCDKNLGVLFSGKKGLGKSLTIKLIVEKIVKQYPVIVINEYTKYIPDILTNLKNSVIVFDEFEKVTREKSEDEGITPQETLLSVLDGSVHLNHNLFLFSVNNVDQIDENMLSRPGRIKYHYRFNSIEKSTVEEYCADNLIASRAGDVEELINVIAGSKVQSMDILQSIVEEANNFPELSIKDISSYMNITECTDSLIFKTVLSYKGHKFVEETHQDLTIGYEGKLSYWAEDISVVVNIPKKTFSFLEEELSLEKSRIKSVCSPVRIENFDQNDKFWKSIKDDDDKVITLKNPSSLDFAIESISVRRDSNLYAF